MQAFKKGDHIPASLRPKGHKILWVILSDELVRKVFDGDDAIFEFRYPKDKIPIHPFVVTQELAKAGRKSRQINFKTDDRTVLITLTKGRVTDLQVGWTTSDGGYLLPKAGQKPQKVIHKKPRLKTLPPSHLQPRPQPRALTFAPLSNSKINKKLTTSLASAQTLLTRGEAHPALVVLKKLAKRYPNNEELVYYEGRATFALGRLAKLRSILTRHA